jgi:hypothetical protein
MSAIEDGALVTQRNHKDDPAYKELLQGAVCASDQGHVADWIDRLYAELTRLRERNAALEREYDRAKVLAKDYAATLALRTARMSSLEATVREMREAIAGLLATPEIADADPRDKDEETQIAERKARAALASSESVVKSEGENDGVE